MTDIHFNSVTFAKFDLCYPIEKDDYNKVEGRKVLEIYNRKLLKMESYMRKNHLLFKNEFLEFTNVPYSHVRIGYIEHICFLRGWLPVQLHLKIVY